MKRSFHLTFSAQYGPTKLTSTILQDGPLNGATANNRFDDLILRGGHNRCFAAYLNPDAAAYTEDEWFRNSQIAMGGFGPHGNFVHLYINGLYWGLYNVCDQPNFEWAALNLGGDSANWFYLDQDANTSGDPTRWNYLIGPLIAKDMTVSANYNELKQHLDVGEYADYLKHPWPADFHGDVEWLKPPPRETRIRNTPSLGPGAG